MLGIGQLHDMVPMASPVTFRRCSLYSGVLARILAGQLNVRKCDGSFIIGVLREIVHSTIVIKKPELSFKALLRSWQQKYDIGKNEYKHFGFDYCQLDADLVKKWHLPEVYSQVIVNHLNPYQCAQGFRFETEIVSFTYHYCDGLGLIAPRLLQIQANRQPHVVTPDNIEKLIAKEISDNIDEAFAMLALSYNALSVTMSGR
jgi:hypothetical protein